VYPIGWVHSWPPVAASMAKTALAYEATKTRPLATATAESTGPPVGNFHRTAPVTASRAHRLSLPSEPTYTTPSTTTAGSFENVPTRRDQAVCRPPTVEGERTFS
jgi:hypothetical protein